MYSTDRQDWFNVGKHSELNEPDYVVLYGEFIANWTACGSIV